MSARLPAPVIQPGTLREYSATRFGEELDQSGLFVSSISIPVGTLSLTRSSRNLLRVVSSSLRSSIRIHKASRPEYVTVSFPSRRPSLLSFKSALRSILEAALPGSVVVTQDPPSLVNCNPVTPVSHQGSKPYGV